MQSTTDEEMLRTSVQSYRHMWIILLSAKNPRLFGTAYKVQLWAVQFDDLHWVPVVPRNLFLFPLTLLKLKYIEIDIGRLVVKCTAKCI